ncbi:MAG: hypothetical protein HYZ87_01650 [Candidatus Omnitrophica bacterium]|nr:hypothetical protein [Candidatus Omnitrophota bacterium]
MIPRGKPKSITSLEQRMLNLSPDSFRYKVLDCAKRFKSSWIELGQTLFQVHRDKTYKDWGYLTFEAYCAKEIGIRQATAIKLLKSYSFLEREEPEFLKRRTLDETDPSRIPGYEAVNALRLVKERNRIPEGDYESLRGEVLDDAKEDDQIKKKIRYLLKVHAPKETPGETEGKKSEQAKRFQLQLRNMRRQMTELDFPASVVKKVDELLGLLENTR